MWLHKGERILGVAFFAFVGGGGGGGGWLYEKKTLLKDDLDERCVQRNNFLDLLV